MFKSKIVDMHITDEESNDNPTNTNLILYSNYIEITKNIISENLYLLDEPVNPKGLCKHCYLRHNSVFCPYVHIDVITEHITRICNVIRMPWKKPKLSMEPCMYYTNNIIMLTYVLLHKGQKIMFSDNVIWRVLRYL